ncbi:MAG: ABC transporter substrate-binding protein [Cellulomonadaceae bacterium]
MSRSTTTSGTRRLIAAAAIASTALLAACSPAAQQGATTTGADGEEVTTVTFRLWDDAVASAYEESFAAFTEANPDVRVDVNVVPWSNYWEQLPVDVGSGAIDDIFWTNSSNFVEYAQSGALVDVGSLLGDQVSGWAPAVVDQYTLDGTLWGVPQLTDGGGIFYNVDLLEEAGVTPEGLTWAPGAGDGDTFLAAAKALTKDGAGRTADDPAFDGSDLAQYGFNAALDLQAIYYPWVASNGGLWQAEESNEFVYGDDERSVEAIAYLVDLINTHHVAPSAADTNENGDFSRDQFLQGKLAIFQSGTYNLANVRDGADFEWALAPAIAGPEGSAIVGNGTVAVASSASEHPEAVHKVLEWIGSDEGASYIGAEGAALPAVIGAQDSYQEYWQNEGVDVTPFLDATMGLTADAPRGTGGPASDEAANPILKEIFLGRIPVAAGLTQAQDAANAAIEDPTS